MFLAATGLASLVAMLAAGLLLHLCIFHVYINLHDLTTYEYVRAQRQLAEAAQREALALAREQGQEQDQEQGQEQEQEQEQQASRCECGGGRGNKVAPKKVSLIFLYTIFIHFPSSSKIFGVYVAT